MLSIIDKLKQARLLANLTQEELAEMLGVSRQTISNWENGRSYPDIVSVITLSDVYDMTLDSLLKGDKEMIKHLKESTDTVKSNKRLIGLIVSLIAFGVCCAAGLLIRDFMPELADTIIINILTLVGFVTATFVTITKSIDIIKLAEQKTFSKALIGIGIIVVNAFVYVALIVFMPEFISSVFQMETQWIKMAVMAATAGVLLIPGYVILKRLRGMLSAE
jgi:transcriptional regulator with XRE-family HTH domain